MKRVFSILLPCLFLAISTGAGAQPSLQILTQHHDGSKNNSRYSPHYYTVKSVLRNHRYLKRRSSAMMHTLVQGKRIPMSEIRVDGDVSFHRGTYEFHASIRGDGRLARLRKVRGKWLLKLYDRTGRSIVATYSLER